MGEMQAYMGQRWVDQEILVCHDESDLSIKYPNGDTMWACRHKSLELNRDVQQRLTFGSHQYATVFKAKRQDEITEGENVLGNPHCVNHDGKQGPPSTEEIGSAAHSLTLTLSSLSIDM